MGQEETQTGAQIIVRSLIEQGVDVVFGYPGGQVLDIYDELYQHASQIKHVITAHEQGAAHAADGYARATGKVGVVIATSGPGATNLVTGIATAHLDSVPLVAITGNVPTNLLGKDSFQETDIFAVTIPITKHNYIVKDINDLARVVTEAFTIAKSGRPGPVLIDVPRDVQMARVARPPAMPQAVADGGVSQASADVSAQTSMQASTQASTGVSAQTFMQASTQASAGASAQVPELPKDALQHAIELIAASKRPFIYSGGGVLAASAGLQVTQFAEHLDAVVGCSLMGLTAIPASHSRNLGMTGMHGHEAAIRAQERADVVIAIGARFSDRATGNKAHYTAGKSFIHIDIDPAEIDKNITTDAAIVGDIKEILSCLIAGLPAVRRPTWQEEIAEIRLEEAIHNTSNSHFDARTIIRAVRTRTSDDTIVVTDVGQHQMWVAQNYPFEKPRTFLTSGGLGTMGYGMGAAIGACLGSSLQHGIEPEWIDQKHGVEPERTDQHHGTEPKKTVLFTGDGSFGMSLNEMATAVSQELPLVIVIMNNGVLGMVRQWQALFYEGRYSNTTLCRVTDFAALARAFGADGCRVKDSDALEAALDKAFAAKSPYVVECAIDEDDKVFPMIPPGGTINNMLLG